MVTRIPPVLAFSLFLAAVGPAALAAPATGEPPATAARPAPEARASSTADRPAAAAPTPAPASADRPAATAPAPAPAKGAVAAGADTVAAGSKGDDPFASPARDGDRKHSDPPAVAIAVPIAFFAFVLLLVAVILLVGFRKERLRHETLRLLVERGAEIPVELLTGPRKKRSSDLRKGVILLASGLGLGLFLALVERNADSHAWSMGFIPALIGLGYLLVWRLEGAPRDGRGDDDGAGPGLPGRSLGLPGHPGASRPDGQE